MFSIVHAICPANPNINKEAQNLEFNFFIFHSSSSTPKINTYASSLVSKIVLNSNFVSKNNHF